MYVIIDKYIFLLLFSQKQFSFVELFLHLIPSNHVLLLLFFFFMFRFDPNILSRVLFADMLSKYVLFSFTYEIYLPFPEIFYWNRFHQFS